MVSWKYDKNYEITEYEPKFNKEISELYSISYQKKKPLKYFEYRLKNTPFGTPISSLMKYKNKIVGFYIVHPIKLKINKMSTLGGYAYLSMVHPNHRGKKIFHTLADNVLNEAKNQEYNFIYTFANENSTPLYLKYLNSIEHPINYVQLNLKIPTNSSPGIIKKNYFVPDLIKLWNKYEEKNNYCIHLEKNLEYFSWRYENNPLFDYYTSYSPGNYFFIFKKYEKILHIIDFFGNTKNLHEQLLSTAYHLREKLSCETITMWMPKDHSFLLFLKNNFKILSSPSHFLVKSLNKNLKNDLFNINNWYYSMGDADIF